MVTEPMLDLCTTSLGEHEDYREEKESDLGANVPQLVCQIMEQTKTFMKGPGNVSPISMHTTRIA